MLMNFLPILDVKDYFDVTVGSYDGAKIFQVLGIILT